MSVPHYIVIGSGVAGTQAATTLRARAPEARISIITMSRLLFYNRYDLPQVFRGRHDWRDFLVFPPPYYIDQRIEVRRNSRVANVDPQRQLVSLSHKEDIRFDRLLIASGGRSYLPEELVEYQPLMHGFATFEQAMTVNKALPEGGQVLLLGGDMIGLDLARTLLDTGYRVTLLVGEYTFWPHQVNAADRPGFLDALAEMGIDLIDSEAVGGIAGIEEGGQGLPARRVHFNDGSHVHADVVMPFFGLVPSVEFMLGSGVDIERGLLVSPELRSTNENVYAAGDVCQIWSAEERRYRFYYGWKNVRAMGQLSAANMTGRSDAFAQTQDETLRIVDGRLNSPFWDYD